MAQKVMMPNVNESFDKDVLTTANMQKISSILKPSEEISEDSPYPCLSEEVHGLDDVTVKAAHEESDLAESLGITTETKK